MKELLDKQCFTNISVCYIVVGPPRLSTIFFTTVIVKISQILLLISIISTNLNNF